MNSRWPVFPCACSFAKTLNERDPCVFPRVGMADNVLMRGYWIIEHKPTGQQAIICRKGEAPLHAEATETCCPEWFATKGAER